MSLLKILGIRSVLLSFLEIVLFFAVVTPIYFSLVAMIYVLINGLLTHAWPQMNASMVLLPLSPASLVRWGGILPVWMWAVEIAGYLLWVMIYWAPSDQDQVLVELRSLVLFFVVAVVGGVAWLEISHRYVSRTIGIFWSIVTGHAGGTG
ncbi:MAG: hypothetical protein ABSH10_00055 [Phycisphaerae bacterium]|jgi:hypothetical protein